MEHVLDIYERPYDARHPVVCEVEQPLQLVQETRVSLPTGTEHLKPVAHGCKRAGPASVFRFCEPMAGRREATPHLRHTEVNGALAVAVQLKEW